MNWFADLGNTRLKLARVRAEQPERLAAFPHAGGDFAERLDAWLATRELPGCLWLASVAPVEPTAMVASVFARRGVEVRAVATRAEALGLRVGYRDFTQLGVDRWLALLAAHLTGAAPCVIANAGSALVCDGLVRDGRHLGGVIAPAPEAMRAALLARAPGLDRRTGEVETFATSTADGIESGCVLAGVALITQVQRSLVEQLGEPVKLILSGGGAATLRPFLPAHELRPDLVLEGLARWVESGAAGHV